MWARNFAFLKYTSAVWMFYLSPLNGKDLGREQDRSLRGIFQRGNTSNKVDFQRNREHRLYPRPELNNSRIQSKMDGLDARLYHSVS